MSVITVNTTNIEQLCEAENNGLGAVVIIETPPLGRGGFAARIRLLRGARLQKIGGSAYATDTKDGLNRDYWLRLGEPAAEGKRDEPETRDEPERLAVGGYAFTIRPLYNRQSGRLEDGHLYVMNWDESEFCDLLAAQLSERDYGEGSASRSAPRLDSCTAETIKNYVLDDLRTGRVAERNRGTCYPDTDLFVDP